jgi:hypothetical protein
MAFARSVEQVSEPAPYGEDFGHDDQDPGNPHRQSDAREYGWERGRQATGSTSRYSGTWFGHAWASIWRVYAGFGWGVTLGIFVGLLIGLSRLMERVFDPTLRDSCGATSFPHLSMFWVSGTT